MSNLRETLVAWTDQRTHEMLAAPAQWGSLEAVEMQVLLLAELRALALRPEQQIQTPRRVLDAYLSFLADRFPTAPALPLFRLVGPEGEDELTRALGGFLERLAREEFPENPFERSMLAIELTFEPGVHPSISAFTSYYEEFRRATRASIARGEGRPRRPPREIEAATDFALEDAVVSAPNGAPGRVLLRLGPRTGQRDFDAEDSVRSALSNTLSLVEWAGTDRGVRELGLDDADTRTRTAVQALRILPRRTIRTVSIGGTLLARPRPAQIQKDHERRFLEIVGAGAEPQPFDESDELRAIDLDRGQVLLGKGKRLACFIHPETLGVVAEVGVKARVRGQIYRPLGGRPFVLAESIEIDPPAEED